MSDLFEPVAIGSMQLRNRIVLPPMGSRHTPGGLVSPIDIAWHAERAHGGAGLIITGGTLVHPNSAYRGGIAIEGWRPAGLAGLRERADAIHAAGAKVVAQLVHAGRETLGGQPEVAQVAPSAIRSPRDPYVPHALSTDEVREIAEAFVDSARIHLNAGYDGVEIHAGHGYLVAQFLSAAANVRTDEFGGRTPVERLAFLRLILRRLRAEFGPEIPLGVRLSAREDTPGGIELEETVEMVGALSLDGLTDYVSITRGVRNSYVKDQSWPFSVAVDEAKAVKAVTDLPVLVTGRIVRPEQAAAIVADGAADLVGIGRGQLADPEWVAKARGAVPGAIRPCVGFVQDCRTAMDGASCAVNAAAGREARHGLRAERERSADRVVVVGGGPGGLETARVAAGLGCRVTLFEAETWLGGQIRRAARGPLRASLLDFVEYQAAELDRLGVEVVTGHRADADDVTRLGANLAVIATGAVHAPAAAPAIAVWDLLDGTPREPVGRAVVVDDGTGFWPAVSAAELLAGAGAQVTLVTPAPAVAAAIPAESLAALHVRLRGAGTVYRPFTVLDRGEPGGAYLRDVTTGRTERVPADIVVVQTAPVALDTLAAGITGVRTRVIGDALSPRRITHAVLEANEVIMEEIGTPRAGAAPAQIGARS